MSTGTILTAVGLAVLLPTGPLTQPGHAQEPIRSISLFPGPETKGVVPKGELPPLSKSSYAAGAFLASVVYFPFLEVRCLSGEVLGFFVGSVSRVFVWAATFGDQLGAGERLDGTGTALVRRGCGEILFVTAEDLLPGQPIEVAPEADAS